jgi:hypothetical protein
MNINFNPENHEYLVDGSKVFCVSDILKAERIIDDRFLKDEYCAERGKLIQEVI